ncbi:hypothetical protein HRbin36_02640 [bacterium HR36]|nr:hypothetical protein HRbin36_02640 [bacterium HR36]
MKRHKLTGSMLATLAMTLLAVSNTHGIPADLAAPVLVEVRPSPPVAGFPLLVRLHHPLLDIHAGQLQWRFVGESHWHTLPGCALALPKVADKPLALQFRVVDSHGQASPVTAVVRTPIPAWPRFWVIRTDPEVGPIYGQPFHIYLVAQSPLLRQVHMEWRLPGQADWQRMREFSLTLPPVQSAPVRVEFRAVDETGLASPPAMFSWNLYPLTRSFPVSELAGWRGRVSLNGLALLAGTDLALVCGDHGLVAVLNWQTGRVTLLAGHDDEEPVWDVATVRTASSGWLGVSGSADGTAIVWNLEKGTLWQHLHGHTGSVNAVAFSPDGQFVLTAGEDGLCLVWEIVTGKIVRKLPLPAQAPVCTLRTWLQDKELMVAIGDANLQFHIWNASADKLLVSQVADTSKVWALAIFPDVRLLTGGELPYVRLWRFAAGKIEHLFDLRIPRLTYGRFYPDATFTAADFTPDGRYALACNRAGQLALWDLHSGELIRTYDQPGREWLLKDQRCGFSDVQVTPDSLFVLTTDRDGFLRVWFIGDRP